MNSAARALAGDVAGRHFTDVVAPVYRGRAREQFLRKLHGKDATSCARSAPTPGSKRSQWRAATA